MGVFSIYQHILEIANDQFVLEKELKASQRSKVSLVRSKKTKMRWIYREFTGNSDVYTKLKTLNSQHLPKIEYVAEKGGKILVLEEYIQGDNLAFLLNEQPLLPEQAEKIAIQLCRALDALHSLGIVHRDIKPENIILRGDKAVLIDFDAARLTKPEQRTDTQAIGTIGYAAPEQFGFSQTDSRADIYSLGVLINEMLTKKHPSKYISDSIYLPIIKKCIEVNIDMRYSSVKEVMYALQNLSSKRDKAAHKTSSGKAVAIIAVCVAVISALLIIFIKPSAPSEPVSDIGEHTSKIETPADSPNTPETQDTPDAIPESPPSLNLIDIASTPWDGPYGDDGYPITSPIEFLYDLDGDGNEEKYIFSMSLRNDNLQDIAIIGDSVTLTIGDYTVRQAVPCVWRVEDDGQWAVSEAFSTLLEDPKITVYRTSDYQGPIPEIIAYNSMWKGGIEVKYTTEHAGTWVYLLSASLGELELKTASKTMIDILQ